MKEEEEDGSRRVYLICTLEVIIIRTKFKLKKKKRIKMGSSSSVKKK